MYAYQQSNVAIYGDGVYGMVAATRMNPIRPIEPVATEELGLGYGAFKHPTSKGLGHARRAFKLCGPKTLYDIVKVV